MLERKVLLAASTMSSLGLMFGAAAASYWVHEEIAGMNLALLVAFWYMAVHAFAKASLFLVSGHLIHATHTRFSVGDLEFGKRMKTTFGVTIIATTFLVGIPLLTAYWVKSAMDHVMEHLFEHGLAEHGMLAPHSLISFLPLFLLILASLVYSGILAKFLSLNFIKGEKPHHEHLEGGGLMKLGYVMMVSMLFVLLYLIFRSEETAKFVEYGLHEPASIAVGIGALIAFGIAVYKPRIASLARLGTFFNDRMYLPFVNDYITPRMGFFIARIVNELGNRAIDGFCNTKVMPGIFGAISRAIRAIQSGYLARYIKIVLGLVMITVILVSITTGGVV